ncbi:hypothetical protein [Acinetobacter pittii]|uniref:hypothetical protein n=1 Tax=Acinetobacter pittii TaxID=48296 RepID=UPI003009D819
MSQCTYTLCPTADYFANQYNDGKTAINPDTSEFDANLLAENIKSDIRDLTAQAIENCLNFL